MNANRPKRGIATKHLPQPKRRRAGVTDSQQALDLPVTRAGRGIADHDIKAIIENIITLCPPNPAESTKSRVHLTLPRDFIFNEWEGRSSRALSVDLRDRPHMYWISKKVFSSMTADDQSDSYSMLFCRYGLTRRNVEARLKQYHSSWERWHTYIPWADYCKAYYQYLHLCTLRVRNDFRNDFRKMIPKEHIVFYNEKKPWLGA